MYFGTEYEYEYIRQEHFQPNTNTNIFVSGILNIRIFEYLQIFEYSNIFVYIQLDSQAGTTWEQFPNLITDGSMQTIEIFTKLA